MATICPFAAGPAGKCERIGRLLVLRYRRAIVWHASGWSGPRRRSRLALWRKRLCEGARATRLRHLNVRGECSDFSADRANTATALRNFHDRFLNSTKA
jgi:hypothetical protein